MIDPIPVAGLIGALVPVLGRLGFHWLRSKQKSKSTLQLELIKQEQSTEERLWKRVEQLEDRVQDLEDEGALKSKALLEQAIQVVRLETKVSDRDGVIAELEAQLRLYEKVCGPLRHVAGAAAAAAAGA